MNPIAHTPLSPEQLEKVDLLAHGIRAAESNDHVRAYIIFDWLLSQKPDSPEYRRWLSLCRTKVTKKYNQLNANKILFRTKRNTQESIDVRLLTLLIPIVDAECGAGLMNVIKTIKNPRFRIPLEINWHSQKDEAADWVKLMNSYLDLFEMSDYSLQLARLSTPNRHLIHILAALDMSKRKAAQAAIRNEPHVSILMSAYNSELTIEYAIQSLLGQEYTNLEIIVVDDASNDKTRDIISQLAHQDSRIKPVFLSENKGPYVCRNIALSKSSGRYLTTHDADDFCHPLRLVEQTEFLTEKTACVAVIGQWLRIKKSGELIFHNKKGGDFLHGAVATMMYRREVVDRIGYYDKARYSADTEYLFRIRAVYGKDSVEVLRKPLVLAAYSDSSLTGSRTTYTDSFVGDCESRSRYRHAWECWHQEQKPHLYLSMNVNERPFDAPIDIL
jgi:hypothetical protein